MESLPDEVIAIILCKLVNPWLHACRLALVSKRLNQAVRNWMFKFFRSVEIHGVTKPCKVTAHLARQYGEGVREMKMSVGGDEGYCDLPTYQLRSHVIQTLKCVSNLEILDLSGCLWCQDAELMKCILSQSNLKQLALTWTACRRKKNLILPSHESSAILNSVSARLSSLRLRMINQTRGAVPEKDWQQLKEVSPNLTALEYLECRDRWCIGAGISVVYESLPWYPLSPGFPLSQLVTSFSKLTHLVISPHYYLEADMFFNLLDHSRAISVLHVAVVKTVAASGLKSDLDACFFKTFSDLPHQFVSLSMQHWRTSVSDRVLVDTARFFPTLREFMFHGKHMRIYRSSASFPEPDENDENALVKLAADCPQLESLCIGGDHSAEELHCTSNALGGGKTSHPLSRKCEFCARTQKLFGPVSALAGLQHLRSLTLSHINLSSQSDILNIAKACPQLGVLQLAAIYSAPSVCIPYLAQTVRLLPHLKILNVNDAQMAVDPTLYNAILACCSLESLSLVCKRFCSTGALREFLVKAPASLRYLNFGCKGHFKDQSRHVKLLRAQRPTCRLVLTYYQEYSQRIVSAWPSQCDLVNQHQLLRMPFSLRQL